jgi:hypothetical protein
MPFRSGALSIRRYRLAEPLPAAFARTATMSLRRGSWRPVDDDRGERESFGWVNPRRLLERDLVWEDCVDGNLAFLAVRRDRKAFSKVLYRARRDELFRATLKEKGQARLSRQQRLALEEQLTIEMLKEVSPVIAFTEMVWDLHTGDFYIGATGKALCERIMDLFATTFDGRLMPQFPALWGHAAMCEQGLEENYDAATAAAGA